MIDDALTNPPMPEWNELSDEERNAVIRELDDGGGCCRCCAHPSAHTAYDQIRKILKSRERRYFLATMGGPSLTTSSAERD